MGEYHCAVDLLFGISCMITDHFCFYLQNRLIQTSQTGGQLYNDTSPFSVPCLRSGISKKSWVCLLYKSLSLAAALGLLVAKFVRIGGFNLVLLCCLL
jgi:hypothetical protein